MREKILSTPCNIGQAVIDEKKPTIIIKKHLVFVITLLHMLLAGQQAFASMAEHQAVLNLVPLAAMNRQVVNSGAWSNPTTWNGGILPKSGENIYVASDKSLVVDIESNLSYKTLRVDGSIKFSSANNVGIKVDTFVVTESGTLEIGSEAARIPASNRVKILIANNGPINRNWDPSNISRGIILQGKTRIFGAEKSAYHPLSIRPVAGSNQIVLASLPTGWSKGDIIAITASKFRKKLKTDNSYQTEDELRVIKSISGTTVTLGNLSNPNLSEPLKYSHASPIAKMPVYAANLSRNVIFASEGGETVPANQRGHFMVMHNPDTIIKGAGFYQLGRTDKSIPINDFKLDADGYRITDVNGNYIPDINTNPRGRYAVHFHHTGTDIKIPPAICSGNAIISSPGWGFVNHTSNVIMENNASYDVFGSHYVSEDGNEIGAFKHNIAIKSEGRDVIVKVGAENHDSGHGGHGFWFESRNLAVEDNVVSGVNNAGLAYFHRLYINGIDIEIPRENLLLADKSFMKDLPTIRYNRIPISHQKDMTVLSSGSALTIIKANRDQRHDVRSIIESLKGYSIVEGIMLQYTEKYTFKNIELVADSSTTWWDNGVSIARQVRDIAIIDSNVEGFVHPFVTGTVFLDLPDQTDVAFSNVMVDGRSLMPEIDIHQPDHVIISNYDPKIHLVNNQPNISPDNLGFTQNNKLSYNLPANLTDGFTVTGAKTDSFGKTALESIWRRDSLIAVLSNGYYTRPDGSKFIILTDNISDRVSGNISTVDTRVNITQNNQLLGPYLGQLPN